MARKAFLDIVYFQLTPEETKRLRHRLSKAKKDCTEDRMVALLAGMFDIYPSREERVEYVKKLEAMDDEVFQQFLHSAEHDPIEQSVLRLGNVLKEAARKAAENISSAGKEALHALEGGARRIDAGASSAAPHVDRLARWLSEQRGGSRWKKRLKERRGQ